MQCATLVAALTTVVNALLGQGRLPDSQKHAIVLPLLKKLGLDAGFSRHLAKIFVQYRTGPLKCQKMLI